MLSNVMVAAVLASAPLAHAIGNAKVINGCEYEVTLCNVPAADGGYSEIDKTLSPNDTYSQEWTQLSNGNGWSIKLSKSASLSNILQYEYTFHNDGIIWYDLSEVNGNPWDGNWEITAEGSDCDPKQQAYRYATDDAYGMQSCSDDAEITVTLCSGESQNDGAAAASSSLASTSAAPATSSAPPSYSSASAVYSSSAVVSSSAAPVTSSAPAPSSYAESSSTEAASTTSADNFFHHTWWNNKAAAPSTTLATSVSTSVGTSVNADGATVTNVQTVVETEVATATVYARHDQHRRRHGHPHARN